MAARHKGKKTNMVAAKGGGEPNIAIPGVDVMKEAKKGSSGFKKGGATPAGTGMAEGGAAPKSLAKAPRKAGGGQIGVIGKGMAGDKAPKKARGGAATLRGRSPMSSAANISAPVGRTTH